MTESESYSKVNAGNKIVSSIHVLESIRNLNSFIADDDKEKIKQEAIKRLLEGLREI